MAGGQAGRREGQREAREREERIERKKEFSRTEGHKPSDGKFLPSGQHNKFLKRPKEH